MHFLAPMAFVFAATIPVVILFYLLKRKRVVRLISSTLLWQKYLAETQASSPFQRLRHNWLLILQIIMLALLVFALTRPFFASPTKTGRFLVVILDASASMQSTDETPTRFEAARTKALQWLESVHDSDQVVILQSASNTQVKQSPTSNKASLRRALKSCEVTDGPTHLTEALKLADTLTREQAHPEIHLFSDGVSPGLNELETSGLPLVFHRFGQRGNNAGVVSLDVKSHPEDSSRRAIYTAVANFSSNAMPAELEFRFNQELLETRPILLKPRETSPQVFAAQQNKDGVFTVLLKVKDDLAVDNQASIISLLPKPIKILLVTRGNKFLERALKSSPNVQLSTSTALSDPASAFDLAVLDDVIPSVWPAVNTVAFHIMNTNWFSGWSTLPNPRVVSLKGSHPLLRFVSFDNVDIVESYSIKTNFWATPVVESAQAPLILAGDLKRQRIVWVGFDPLNSTWPFRFSFPIFIANTVEWLNPSATYASQLFVKAGNPFRFALSQPMTNILVKAILPGGTERSVTVEPGAPEVVFGETARQGLYQIQIGTNRMEFCVNLLDQVESDTMPKSELSLGKHGKVLASTAREANLEIWRWIAALGLLVLMVEWWYYHRRTA